MNIKYNKHKQELRDDPIMDFLINVKEYFMKNGNFLLIALVAIVVVLIGFSAYNIWSKNNEKKIQDAFGIAMISYNNMQSDKAIENFKLIADKYPGSVQGIQSAFLLAGIFYDQSKYDDAIKYFSIASKEKQQFIGGQAVEGIAACYEAKGDVPSALKYLEKALDDKRIAYRHGAIKWKIALLTRSTDVNKSKKLCNEIISDTTATEYHQPAENLLAVMENAG